MLSGFLTLTAWLRKQVKPVEINSVAICTPVGLIFDQWNLLSVFLDLAALNRTRSGLSLLR
jgi:hypothetical protein